MFIDRAGENRMGLIRVARMIAEKDWSEKGTLKRGLIVGPVVWGWECF